MNILCERSEQARFAEVDVEVLSSQQLAEALHAIDDVISRPDECGVICNAEESNGVGVQAGCFGIETRYHETCNTQRDC